MGVTQRDLINGQTVKRSKRPGMIKGAFIERLLIALIHELAWLLIILSVLGTFYGARGQDAPLLTPGQIIRDIWAQPIILGVALIGQGLLSVVQWGSRVMAVSTNRYWWLAYFGALALSVWWNWQAYGDPMLILGVPWLIAIGFVIGGDMLPELALVTD